MLLSDEIGNWAGDITKAQLPDKFLVDYVRVYDLVDGKGFDLRSILLRGLRRPIGNRTGVDDAFLEDGHLTQGTVE